MATVYYRNASLSEVNMFYREAGDASNPTILLLHGFPSSSHMFRGLIPLLACFLHVVAPDYPGFGYTDSPPATDFAYTFDHLAGTVEELIHHLGIRSYFLYVMDYGAPVGFRIMEANPERVLGLVVQNGIAHEEGLTSFWDPIRKYWKDKNSANEEALLPLFTFDTTKSQYTIGAKDVEKVSPDAWYFDYYFLQLPGHTQIQLDLFYDYRTNLDRYPGFQATFRKYQYPTLIVWGKHDFIFGVPGAKAFLRDLPSAELHLLDGGHFVLEDHLKEVAEYILKFAKKVKT
jgi:pimeloyl-ACP methyl ester carboxylesterase